MFSRFFIDRPIFAAVLSILITLGGALSLWTLPLAQFPNVSPPTVQVQCVYPGASAEDVATAVAAPIEQEVNGVEGMMYMSSQCTNDGQYSLTVTFHQGVDLDMAQVLVQNRVSLATNKLPDVIKATGVTTRKRTPDVLIGFAIISPQGRYQQVYLSNFALRLIRDELERVPGVSEVYLFGQRDYSMRVWLDPLRMAERSLSAGDVTRAIRAQNQQVAAGQIGQQPVPAGQVTQVSIDTLGRLDQPEQFENIVLRSTTDGRSIRLKDVARVELGARSEDTTSRFDRFANAFVVVFQSPDANALETANAVIAKMDELKRDFPEDVAYETAFDTIPYTRESINEVVHTLRDAVILVALVVLLFLQNWRSALIPLIAVPVAVIGTFAVMKLMGFSLNNLTMFGLILAIGIVVDDAIVVVEAVEHHIENGLAPRAATIKAMEQVSGPVIAVGLVLTAVFVPCAFISGITGLFFRQFALTISVSTIISAFNSLTLSPALTALLLRPRDKQAAPPLPLLAFAVAGGALAYYYALDPLRHWLGERSELAWLSLNLGVVFLGAGLGWLAGCWINPALAYLFRAFNRGFGHATSGYVWLVGRVLRFSMIGLALYVGLLALNLWVFVKTPRGFIPTQDMGLLMVSVQLPDTASLERTEQVMRQIHEIVLATPGVRHATAISGQSFAISANGSNFGSMFVNLDFYPDRRDPNLHAVPLSNRLRKKLETEIPDARVAVFVPPAIRGVGRAGGFSLVIEDRGDAGPAALQEQVEDLVRLGNQNKQLSGLFSVFRANVPQLKIQPDLRECVTKGVSLQEFADTLRVFQGSLYVNDFNLFERSYQVIVQADAPFRDQPDDILRFKVRNRHGQMVPIGALASIQEVQGPLILSRHNMYPSATINGSTAPGVSSGQGIDILKQLADANLPTNMAYEWSDMSYLELQAGNTATLIFILAVAMVFLVLAAQYESWSLPLAVILVVPMCVLSALVGVNVAGMDINIFTQIGFVVLVGLASKNAILIVEFAKLKREEGAEAVDAALAACRLRLRPIIMTSLAFILGVVPLVFSRGAGAEMRQTLGTAVFSGMIGVTLFGIVLTPLFFFVIDQLSRHRAVAGTRLAALGTASSHALGVAGRGLLTGGLYWIVAWLRRRWPPRPKG